MVVTFEVRDDAVGVVTLNRPDKLNAMSYAVFEQLHRAGADAAAAAASGDCRAVMVTGAGRAFSAGLDVSLFAEQASGQAPDDDHIAYLQQAFTVFEDLPVPTVAAVRGVAIGGGCQLAMACHLRIAAPDAKFGLLEARWALIPDLGATWRLPRLVGLSRATDLAMSGRTVDALTAAAWGLVDAVCEPDGDFEQWASDYVAQLAAGPTTAIGAVPALMRDSYRRDRDAVLAAERATQQRCLASADFREAATAGIEGRRPHFSGR
jgi:enoyl-CoA hydratase/carnithine racemase